MLYYYYSYANFDCIKYILNRLDLKTIYILFININININMSNNIVLLDCGSNSSAYSHNDISLNSIKTDISTLYTIKTQIKLEKNKSLKRQTHLYCKNCSSCQSEYNKLHCDECGILMIYKNQIYY